MALIKCPECGREISDSVKICPHCGKRLKKNFFQKYILSHKIISGLVIIVCAGAIGIAVYVNTHTFLTYEENVILESMNHIKDVTAYKESVQIQRVEVAYSTKEKWETIYGKITPASIAYTDYSDSILRNITNVYIEYKMLDRNDEMVDTGILCSLDENGELEFSFSEKSDSLDEYSGYVSVAELQRDIEDFHIVKKETIKKLSKLDDSKKIVVTNKFPEITTDDLDDTLMKYINYQMESVLDTSYYQNTSLKDLMGGKYEPSVITDIKECVRFLYKGIIIKHNKNRANLH